MAHNSSSVLGSNWLLSFNQFRLNPETFFDKRKLTREAFCLDVLRDIHLDHIDVECKTRLLLLLQEYSTILIKDFNLLEQILGSLINFFDVLKNSVENRLIRSQILITVTTILLSNEAEDGNEELLYSIKKLLLRIICDKNEDFVLISTACKCLEEIEMCYPNILKPEIKAIFSSCEKHYSPAFQNYASLLSLCARNMCLSSSDGNLSENGNLNSIDEKHEIQESILVSYLMELIPLMSPLSVYRVLKNLIPVVKHSSSISCVIFKLFLPNLIFSSEVVYFHLAFDFLEAFQLELFTAQEEKCLLRQLMLLSSHPCLTLSHRMLFLDWLKSCIRNKEIFSSPLVIFKGILPGPFDGPVTQEKKSCILALYVPKNVDKDFGLEFLDECVSGLHKCALLPNGTKAAASFFRTLFVYFSHHKPELIHNYMYKLLLGIMKTSPHLLKYALSFLDAVKTDFPESSFPKDVLTHMVDHILSLPMKQFTRNLECYLAVLEQASKICGSECKPRSILRLIQKLLMDSDLHENNVWEFGNNMLSVCRAILNCHDAQIFYYDLAEVLCLISQSIDDVDIKDRAKIYYSVLTTLSKLKIQSIFKMQLPKKDLKNSLTSFVPGVNSQHQFASCIKFLPKSILQLVRMKKNWNILSDNGNIPHQLCDKDILRIYNEHIDSQDSVVQLPFLLKHISDSENSFDSLYGITISTKSFPLCKAISVIQIPVFKNSGTLSEGNEFHIDIIPHKSQPTELHFKVEFTCHKGYNYICQPDPICLKFQDLFLTLPVPKSLQNYNSSWKKSLFEILWRECEKKIANHDELISCKSAICLKMNKVELTSFIEEHWKQFIVAKFDEIKCWIAIFLPSKYHLLMKIDMINENPFINFVVDDISNLPWAALYLQEVTTC